MWLLGLIRNRVPTETSAASVKIVFQHNRPLEDIDAALRKDCCELWTGPRNASLTPDVRPSSLVKLVLMRGSDPQEAAEYCGMLDFPVLQHEIDFPRLLQSSPGHHPSPKLVEFA